MKDPGFAPESIAYARQELRDLDKFLPRPTIGQFCSCMGNRAQQIIDRYLQLRRHSCLVVARARKLLDKMLATKPPKRKVCQTTYSYKFYNFNLYVRINMLS